MRSKICTRCRTRQPIDRFSPRGRGTQARCKACCAEQAREYRSRHPDRVQAANRKALYGISLEETGQLLGDQDGCCACCRRPITLNSLRVDHCHTTSAVRGLLCQSCNAGIGLLGDTASGVERALEYLRRSEIATATS